MEIKLNTLEVVDKIDFLKISVKLGVGNATEIYWENPLPSQCLTNGFRFSFLFKKYKLDGE